ncbi:MAG TPA: kelch repeat-containing protein [Polyangia bacterium]|nr:kelch repeat-containing protein [Polyangia bacterium]
MCQGFFSNTWHRLTPDAFGSYLNGTWDTTPIAPMPDGVDARIGCTPCAYAPLFFASQVLADGKVVVIGGEDLAGFGNVETNIGFLYDPVTNSWSQQLGDVFGSGTVGDTMSNVLANGTMLVSQITSTNLEAFNESTLSFTALNPTGKADPNNEEGWEILPNGTMLTVDARIAAQSEIYNPITNVWDTPLNTIVNMADTGDLGGSIEVGPATLRPDGIVVSFTGNSLGENALFNTLTNTWSHPAGIDFPLVTGQTNHFGVKDGPAVTLPNGNVLVMASPVDNVAGDFLAPSHFWEVGFTTNTLVQVADSPNAASFASFDGHFMMLPSGETLFVAFNQGTVQDVDVYTNGGAPQNAWRPTITSSPATITQGSMNNTVSGTLFNGLSQGAAYGDDSQSFTNYPLVRITNNGTGHVFYARTHNHSRMGVEALGDTETITTQFDVPAAVETGACTLVVVANGIASAPAACNVVANQAVACESGLSFLVDDRAQVQNGTGGPGAVNNNGTGSTRLSPDSRTGAITSRAAVTIQHRSVVTGNVVSASTVTKDSDATVTGTITANGTVNLPPLPTLPAFPPPTAGSFTVNSGTVSKAPGSYVSGTVNGGTLVLAAGDYFFQSFTINSGAVVRATPTTRIFVQSSLAFNASILASSGTSVQPIFLGYAGSNSVSLGARFDGTLVAPNASVVFGAGPALTFSGSFFARTIEVAAGSTLACHL